MGAGPGARQGVSPATPCAAFLPEDQPRCEERVCHHLARMDELEREQTRLGMDQRCHLQCDLYQEM